MVWSFVIVFISTSHIFVLHKLTPQQTKTLAKIPNFSTGRSNPTLFQLQRNKNFNNIGDKITDVRAPMAEKSLLDLLTLSPKIILTSSPGLAESKLVLLCDWSQVVAYGQSALFLWQGRND